MRKLIPLRSLALAAVLSMWAGLVAAESVVTFVFMPANPQPTDTISVFVRVYDPVTGIVDCPANSYRITNVTSNAGQVVLDLDPVVIGVGLPVPVCDGNTVLLGPLAAGVWTVTARYVFPSGNVSPPVLASQLVVGAAPIPALGPLALVLCALVVGAFGFRWGRRDRT